MAGIVALRGGRAASLIYLGMLLLVPRPLMAPLAVWLLWQRPDLRVPFAAMFVAHAIVVVASGYALPWFATMATYDLSPGVTIGPTAIFGRWWLFVGIPIAAWLTLRGWVGWAGIAASPYLTPQYVIWPLLDLDHDRGWRDWLRNGVNEPDPKVTARTDGLRATAPQTDHAMRRGSCAISREEDGVGAIGVEQVEGIWTMGQ